MIYVITHKKFDDSFIDKEHYKILHVGTNDNCKSYYLRDDTGNNISEKNANYCELTGLYWIWKNAQEAPDDITGLVHYRRFFTTSKEDFLYTYFDVAPKILNYNSIENSLKSYDLILPKRVKIFRTVKQFYDDIHIGEDLDLTRDSIKTAAPEYLNSYDEVLNSHYFYFANMAICRRRLLNEYCIWLFNIMHVLESKIEIDKYEDSYQARVFGFISERLLQVWVLHNKLSIKEYPVFNTEEKRITIFEKNKNRITKLIKIVKEK